MKKFFLILFLSVYTGNVMLAQNNVGIGTSSPAYKLDVTGTIHSNSNAYFDGNVGVGTTSPNYKFQVNGSIAVFNPTDAKSWYFNYNSGANLFYLAEDGFPRLTLANGGNVGIGTTSPDAKLDVNGTANVGTDLKVGGNAAITGNLTVNNGKGIVRSWNGTQLKYYTQQASFHAILGAFGTSAQGSITWPSGIFTSPPKVLVGDITATSGTLGQLWRVQLVTYDATTTNCHFRVINTWDDPVDYNITWNIILIGE